MKAMVATCVYKPLLTRHPPTPLLHTYMYHVRMLAEEFEPL
jgi:hypothetical protein